MSVDSDKSKRLKAILKVGEEPLVTHKGDSEDSLLKSSSNLGAGNSNQEFVINLGKFFEGWGLFD